MFKLIRLSMEGLILVSALAFVALWVILQEYGTVLIWLLVIFLVVKLLKYHKEHQATQDTYIAPPAKTGYPTSHVTPVVIDRKFWVADSVDKTQDS